MKLDFGKYKNANVQDIIRVDPKYIRWCISYGCLKLPRTYRQYYIDRLKNISKDDKVKIQSERDKFISKDYYRY